MSLEFIRIASINEVPVGTLKTFSVNNKRILLGNIKGQYYAIGAVCTHKECDLSDGTLDEDKTTDTCACHGAIFDLKTGNVIFHKPIKNEPIYEVRVSGMDILVKW